MINRICASSPAICIIADIVVVLFLIIMAIIGAKKGLVKCLTSFTGTIVALVLAFLLALPITSLIDLIFGMTDSIASSYQSSLLSQNEIYSVVIGADGLRTALETAKIPAFLIDSIMNSNSVVNWSIPDGTTLAAFISPIFAKYTSLGIMFIILFVIFEIVALVVGKVLQNKFEDKEFSNKLNFSIGAIIGLVVGIIFLAIIFFVLSLIKTLAMIEFIEGTFFIEMFCNANIFGLVFTSIFSTQV